MVNAGDCDPIAIRSKPTITAFAKEIVKAIDMVAFGKPQVVMFGTGDKKGYTLVQLIETSCITAHFVEEYDDIYLDIFSCSSFEKSVALAVFRRYFSPKNVNATMIARRAA